MHNIYGISGSMGNTDCGVVLSLYNPKFERYIPFNIHFCEFNVLFPRVQSGAASVGDRNCSASSEFAG